MSARRRLRHNVHMEKSPSPTFLQAGWFGYLVAVAAAAGCTLAGVLMQPRFDIVNIAMVYLLAVVVIALLYPRGAAVAAAACSVAAFDFVFVPPAGTFTVHDVQYLLTFAILLAVALIISGLLERARRGEAERTALALATERERMRSALLASISHDLRTPLAVMAGASSSLAERGEQMTPQGRAELARSLFLQAQDLAGQVDKVLQMTRFEMGAIQLERDWASLAEIAGSVLERLRERLARHQLVVEIPGDLPLVRVDAPLIAQVFTNLLENAARHTPADTLVHLRARRNGSEIEVSIDDFGPGLENRDIERIFDKFYGRSEEGPAGGAGLGLAICRAIIGLHGGRIRAEQIPGGGTCFRFFLPVEEAPGVPPEAGPEGARAGLPPEVASSVALSVTSSVASSGASPGAPPGAAP